MNPVKSGLTRSRYIQKARSSFNARFDLLLFERISHCKDGEIKIEELDNFEIIVKPLCSYCGLVIEILNFIFQIKAYEQE
jgi:hypothetical protein